MEQFHIRAAIRTDKEAIADLWVELMEYHRSLDIRFYIDPQGRKIYLNHTQEMIRSGSCKVLVAEKIESGEVVGYLMGELQNRPPGAQAGTFGFISDIYVKNEWRQRGVGTALFEEMKRWFTLKKASAVELYIAQANPEAAGFWRSMGLLPFLTLMHLEL